AGAVCTRPAGTVCRTHRRDRRRCTDTASRRWHDPTGADDRRGADRLRPQGGRTRWRVARHRAQPHRVLKPASLSRSAIIKLPFAGSTIPLPSRLTVDKEEMHVNAARIEIRRLTSADAAAYRELLLAALRDSPEAFGSTLERESTEPLAWFRGRLGNTQVFGAFRSSELLGIAGFARREGEKEKQKGLLWGMYVRPDARNTGVGQQLIEAVIDYARQHVELIQLSVVSDNER